MEQYLQLQVFYSVHMSEEVLPVVIRLQYCYSWSLGNNYNAIVAMALLALTMRECIMRNSRNLKTTRNFETLYHPFDKLEWIFEVYFNIMVICAVGVIQYVEPLHWYQLMELWDTKWLYNECWPFYLLWLYLVLVWCLKFPL